MVKKKQQKNKINLVTIVIIVFLVLTNIILLSACLKLKDKDIDTQEVLYTLTKDEFNHEKKYYTTLKYSKFKSLYKSKKVTTIAIVDNSTSTYNKFIEMINKTAYYKSTKIQLLRINKLSKKDLTAFYNLDDRFKELDTNYIITVSNKKILSITTFNNQELNTLIEGLGE
jgi:hypothetical protein